MEDKLYCRKEGKEMVLFKDRVDEINGPSTYRMTGSVIVLIPVIH
jgi:hypothetical protein